MGPNEVWDTFLGEGRGAVFRSVTTMLSLIPLDAFNEAESLINRELSVGPLLNPSAYVGGERFDNATNYIEVIRAARQFRAVLEKHLARQTTNPTHNARARAEK
jgi:hypothetical protein